MPIEKNKQFVSAYLSCLTGRSIKLNRMLKIFAFLSCWIWSALQGVFRELKIFFFWSKRWITSDKFSSLPERIIQGLSWTAGIQASGHGYLTIHPTSLFTDILPVNTLKKDCHNLELLSYCRASQITVSVSWYMSMSVRDWWNQMREDLFNVYIKSHSIQKWRLWEGNILKRLCLTEFARGLPGKLFL